jgi:outer membrane protein TolC
MKSFHLFLIFTLLTWIENGITRESSAQLKPISLKECLELSLANSPRLKVAGLEQIRLQHSYKATVGNGLPQVNISGSWDDFVNLPTQMIPNFFSDPPNPSEMIPVQFGTTYNITGALDVSQMLYNQSWLVALRLERQMQQQNEIETEKSRIEVVHEVAQSYYLAQITFRQIRNMEDNIAKLEKAEKIAGSQYENGLIMRIDLDRIVVQKLNLITDLERLGVVYQQELAMQKYFMGLPQETEIILSDSLLVSAFPDQKGNLNDHVEIRLLEMQKQLAGSTVRLDQAAYFPSLTFIGSTSYVNQSNSWYLFGKPTDWFNTSLLGLRLSVPVFSGMQRHYKVSQSMIELDKLRIMEEDTQKMIRINSDDAWRKLQSSSAAEKRQRDNKMLAERVYIISQEQYQKGVIPLTDLLNAETALSDARTNHTYALVQMKISELNYLKANGKLLNYFNL